MLEKMERTEQIADQYMPTPNDDPYANPLLANSLNGLPPALVQVAGEFRPTKLFGKNAIPG